MPAPTRFRDITNVNLGVLNGSKDKHLVKYVASSGTYVLASSDIILSSPQVIDNDLPDSFVSEVEDSIDAANLEFGGIDGGAF